MSRNTVTTGISSLEQKTKQKSSKHHAAPTFNKGQIIFIIYNNYISLYPMGNMIEHNVKNSIQIAHRPMVHKSTMSNANIYIGRRFESNITNYQTQIGGWEYAAAWACGLHWLKVFIIISTAASCTIIDTILPFSIGKATQGPYFPPHCRYITPYDEMVRAHKQKQKMEQEFAMVPPTAHGDNTDE